MWHLGSRLSSNTLPYEETSTQATVQNKMPSRDQLLRLLAGWGLLFPQPLTLSARMWPGETSRGRADSPGVEGRSGAVLARCPSSPPSPWTSSRTRSLDLFIHRAHLLEIDWAGLCVLLGTRGKTWACDYKGQSRGDPGEAGEQGHSRIPTPVGYWLGRPTRAKGRLQERATGSSALDTGVIRVPH